MATKSKCRLPDLYDGSSSATRFFKRYEICCDLNKWETDNDKVGQLYPLQTKKLESVCMKMGAKLDTTCGVTEMDINLHLIQQF